MSILVSSFRCNFRLSVDLSADGNTLAIGTNDESIRMYTWNGSRYNAFFNGVPAGPAASLSLSGDGISVAVGLPLDSSNGGSTSVYTFYPESPCEDTSEMSVRISFTTDENPHETSWELSVDSEVKLRSGLLSGHKYTTFVEEICVPETSCVRFSVNDTEGDGVSFDELFVMCFVRLDSLPHKQSYFERSLILLVSTP